MHFYFNIFGRLISGYSLMILCGLVLINVLAALLMKKYKLNIYDFIIMEAYILLGAMLGAKLLYLWVSRGMIDWSRMTEPAYFTAIMTGGFVFYGGLIGAAITGFLGCKLHKIDFMAYMRRFIFLVPLAHGFGRLGCFMAGCCYGMPYDGVFAVEFPVNSAAPAGVSLFPVQLFEAILLWTLAAVIYFILRKKEGNGGIVLYIAGYSVIRFITEFLRYDADRGKWLWFSTSQWISIFLVLVLAAVVIWRKVRKS